MAGLEGADTPQYLETIGKGAQRGSAHGPRITRPLSEGRVVAMFRVRTIETLTARLRAAFSSVKLRDGGYEPAKHYMRGPGPKSREAQRRADRSVRHRTDAGTQL